MSEPRRHHFVPRSYLANFTDSGEVDGRLAVLDVVSKRSWKGNPASVGHERDLARISDGRFGAPSDIESLLSGIEATGAPIIRNIIATEILPRPRKSHMRR